MRAIGKRSIAFGLVSVPVKVYTATQDHDIALHQVHDKDHGRIRYERRCDVCGKVIPFEHIDHAYEEGERTVVIDDDDMDALPAASRDDIEVVEFVPSEQVDAIRFERSYFLEPEKAGVRPYALLRHTLQRTERTAIVTFALRQKTHLGALRVYDEVIMLQALFWGDEVREADFAGLASPPSVSAKEQQLADSLVKSLESDFTPDAYRDDYQEELRELIEAKLEKGDAVDTAATFGEEPEEEKSGADSGGEVVDLMEALRRSVDRTRSGAKSTASGAREGAARSKPVAKRRTAAAPRRKGA